MATYFLSHYGTKRHSGRYPWGSGDDPQRGPGFLKTVDELKTKGLSEKDIAEGMGLTTSQLRAKRSIAKAEERKANVAQALKLKDKGYSNVEIGKRMGINESSVRALLNPAIQERSQMAKTTADMLKENVDSKKYIDVGLGVEKHLGISRTKLMTSLAILKEEGYRVHRFDIQQVGTGKKTNMMVLTKEDVGYGEMLANKDKIRMITDYSEDGGRSFLGLEPIRSVSSERVHIRYNEDGGSDKDGVIELRPGVDDISLGNARYAQVRIGVDGTHYLKGMAMYSEDIPKGADIIYNTNKPKGTPPEKVFKAMKTTPDGQIDSDNPFGATVRQQHFITEKGKKNPKSQEMLALKLKGKDMTYEKIAKIMGLPEELVKESIGVKALNIVNEEGDWGDWAKTISSQMLSKQSPALAKRQLGLSYDVKKEEFDEIMTLTNPAVKKKLLESFADDADSSAVHLKAAALPRQGAHVILPFPSMKETEIYAPNYRNGEQVVLIRYPHGGIFEIPQLTVNNKHPEANKLIKQAKDAVGINSKVAERLSGADFDGDTVLVIPNNQGTIKTSSPLKGLMNFDPKLSYPAYEGMPKMSAKTKAMKMGDISNLITDMTIKGANQDEIARAVRHSMVVIDAEKHNLNYKQSYIDNGIGSLKKKYQGSDRSGASTLISRASSQARVGIRKLRVDPNTGKKIYEYTGEGYVNAKGNKVLRTTKSKKMAETEDAFTLSSGTPMETVYATHANKLKALGNQARKVALNTEPIRYSPTAKKTYAKEVSSLTMQLNLALKNKPLERQAQLLANAVVAAKRADNPEMEEAELKKIKFQALAEARVRTGANKYQIEISDNEWKAIQSGAVSNNVLSQILNNTDLDKIKQLATPRVPKTLSASKKAMALRRLQAGYTTAEVADSLGVSTSLIRNLTDES